MSRKYYTK